MFTTTNLPSISSTDLGVARQVYALLVGRVSGVSASVYADEKNLNYVVGAPLIDRFKQNEIGIFGQDSWRIKPSFTLNYGLRWEFIGVPGILNKLAVLPTGGLAGVWGPSGVGNLFKPGTLTGSAVQLDLAGDLNGRPFYKNDWNNFSPAVGFAWTPEFEGGFLNEFKAAQRNLTISRAQGRGSNFRSQGLAGQVNLPIFASIFASATSASFGSTTFITDSQRSVRGIRDPFFLLLALFSLLALPPTIILAQGALRGQIFGPGGKALAAEIRFQITSSDGSFQQFLSISSFLCASHWRSSAVQVAFSPCTWDTISD